ncbi:hypothetical protein RND81_12G014100 [Saponaria officinalis]|uniref:ATP-dependent RNA helicase n=2 Tax=Saponaria officinalis TaxID=3572 RepID=A0AAW1H5Y4_SAPOF
MGKKRGRPSSNEKFEHLDKLPWKSSISSDDPFSIFADSQEGGFLSLEEIDESQFNLAIPQPQKQIEKKKSGTSSKVKKQKQASNDGDKDNDEIAGEEEIGEQGHAVKKRKKNKRKKKAKQVEKLVDKTKDEVGEDFVDEDGEEFMDEDGEDIVDEDGENFVDKDEFNAWNELRLHPLLMKAIYKLGFKEPTPIQKNCIPVAAHQGKDVFGAAETGSGKTLAFGLPILQRLLDEQDKVEKRMIKDQEDAEKIAPRSLIRALIITPTRELALQVTDHLKAAARYTKLRVVSVVGGMSTEKQERLLKKRPEIIVGTPGRLWELMSGGENHLVELHSLSFFVLDEADRMIENGHFDELQSIIDMLPVASGATDVQTQDVQNCTTVSSVQRKKRQTFLFSATIALSPDFRKKLKRGNLKSTHSVTDSLENLSSRAGMKPDAAHVDLTTTSIMTSNLEESFLECREEDKDAYMYYILCVHGKGKTIVFCTSIAALRHVSALLRLVNINVGTIHSQMQQRARLKAMDRFRKSENGILVATDVLARGLDIPGVRSIIHYQLPHSAEVYIHRSGRTARGVADGCSIALISPNDRLKFATLCKSFAKDTLQRFPIENTYMPEVLKRLSLARQIDKILRKDSQEKASENWVKRSLESMELDVEANDSEDERVGKCKRKKATSMQLKKLQEDLNVLLSRPLQPKTFSHRFLAGGGVSPHLQRQLEELTQKKSESSQISAANQTKIAVIGQDCVEPLQALRRAGPEVRLDVKTLAEKQRNMDNLRRKRKEAKKRQKEQKKKERERRKEAADN